MVGLVLHEEAPGVDENPVIEFDWYVPLTITWPTSRHLLEIPTYEQISSPTGVLELKFHPGDDLVEVVLVVANDVEVIDRPLAPVPTDVGPLSLRRSARGAGDAPNRLHVTANTDYLTVSLGEQDAVAWVGVDPVLFGRSAGGEVVSFCARWTDDERRLVLHQE